MCYVYAVEQSVSGRAATRKYVYGKDFFSVQAFLLSWCVNSLFINHLSLNRTAHVIPASNCSEVKMTDGDELYWGFSATSIETWLWTIVKNGSFSFYLKKNLIRCQKILQIFLRNMSCIIEVNHCCSSVYCLWGKRNFYKAVWLLAGRAGWSASNLVATCRSRPAVGKTAIKSSFGGNRTYAFHRSVTEMQNNLFLLSLQLWAEPIHWHGLMSAMCRRCAPPSAGHLAQRYC